MRDGVQEPHGDERADILYRCPGIGPEVLQPPKERIKHKRLAMAQCRAAWKQRRNGGRRKGGRRVGEKNVEEQEEENK